MTRLPARAALAVVALLASVGGACAKDKAVSNSTTGTSVDFEREPGSPGASGPIPSVSGLTRTGGPYTASEPPPPGFREGDLVVRGAVPITARVEPGCVEHGQTLAVTARSRKGIYIRMNVVFPNGQTRDLPSHTATAGSAGTVGWSVEVTDAAKAGTGAVQISARDPDSGEAGTTGTWDFVVAPPGGCAA